MSIEEPLIETFDMSNGFVKAAAAFLIGVMLLGGFVFGAQSTDPKSATITMADIPHDGDTVQLGAHTFEFDSGDGVGSGNIPVTIGDTLYTTGNNFKAAVQANTDFGVN